MTNKTLVAWITRYAWRVILGLAMPVAAFVIFGVIAVLVASLPLPRRLDPGYAVAGALVLFSVLGVGGAAAFSIWMVFRRARRLDSAFTPLGLTGSAYFMNGRQYHGTVQGRRVDVYFYRGPALDIYVASPLKTRSMIGPRDSVGTAVNSMFNRRPIPFDDPELAPLNVFGQDEEWTRALLAEPAARDILLRLTGGGGPIELRQVHVQPDGLLLRHYRTKESSVTPESARRWLDDLRGLARLAEALPPPRQTVEASKAERNARVNRDAFTLPAFGITCGLLVVLAACALVPVAVLLLSEVR